MLKKKRLFWIAFTCALGLAGYFWGAEITLILMGSFFLALGLLWAWKCLFERRGMNRLLALQSVWGYEAQIATFAKCENSDTPLTVIILGDTRNNSKVAREIYRRALEDKPDVIFHTGDIARGGSPSEFLRHHVGLLQSLSCATPVFCVPGNHDRGIARDFAGFKTLFGNDRFAFQHGNVVFVGFNNCGRNRVGCDELAFLDKELEKTATWKFVFTHIPPAFFERAFVLDHKRRGFKENAEAFHEIMRRRQVTEVFMAHIHGYASIVRDGIRYTLTAGGGAPLSRRIAPDGRANHYLVYSLRSDEIRRVRVMRSDKTWHKKEIYD